MPTVRWSRNIKEHRQWLCANDLDAETVTDAIGTNEQCGVCVKPISPQVLPTCDWCAYLLWPRIFTVTLTWDRSEPWGYGEGVDEPCCEDYVGDFNLIYTGRDGAICTWVSAEKAKWAEGLVNFNQQMYELGDCHELSQPRFILTISSSGSFQLTYTYRVNNVGNGCTFRSIVQDEYPTIQGTNFDCMKERELEMVYPPQGS